MIRQIEIQLDRFALTTRSPYLASKYALEGFFGKQKKVDSSVFNMIDICTEQIRSY